VWGITVGHNGVVRFVPSGVRNSTRIFNPVLVVCSDIDRGCDYVAGLRAHGLLAVRVDAADALIELNSIVDFSAVLVDIARNADWWVLLQLAALRGPAPLIPIARPAADGCRYRQFAFTVGCPAFVAKPTDADRIFDTIVRLRRGEAHVATPAVLTH
jgi:hypothetical protein